MSVIINGVGVEQAMRGDVRTMRSYPIYEIATSIYTRFQKDTGVIVNPKGGMKGSAL